MNDSWNISINNETEQKTDRTRLTQSLRKSSTSAIPEFNDELIRDYYTRYIRIKARRITKSERIFAEYTTRSFPLVKINSCETGRRYRANYFRMRALSRAYRETRTAV